MSIDRRALALVAILAAPAAGAEPPLSAIDWLSRSDTLDPRGPVAGGAEGAPAPGGPARMPGEVAGAIPTNPIVVTPLGARGAGSSGVLPSSVTGLPRTLWAGSDPSRLLRRIEGLPRSRVPAVDALAETLMVAEADPPRGADPPEAEALLEARVDQLMRRGALDAATALLDRAGAHTPERRRRAFDVALLTGDEAAACGAADTRPRSQGDYARRVFCLVREGDWAAGALTFDGARALGALDPVEEALLATFIDDELADGPLPPAPAEPTPLAFRLYDALGEPMPTAGLPIAFARADLRDVTGWKAQLEAAERLARAGAIGGNRLLALYTQREPSASGGVWDRVAAVQALDQALRERDADAVAAALPDAWDAMAQAGTLVPLAEALAPRLVGLPIDGPPGRIALRLGLLAADYETVAATWSPAADPGDREAPTLAAIARGEAPAGAGPDPVAQAVARGFDGGEPPARLTRLAEQDRLGEALLAAIQDVAAGAEGDPDHLPGALRFLREAGLEGTARRAALQLLILKG